MVSHVPEVKCVPRLLCMNNSRAVYLLSSSVMPLIQMTLRHEDGDDETQLPPSGRKDRRRASVGGTNERRGLERRRSRRHSLQNSRGHASAPASPSSPHTHASSFLPFGGQRIEDISER